MAWIELHQTLPNHIKLMKLKRLLKINAAQAIGHLCMLWLWALDNAPDGSLSAVDNITIAEVCGWNKSADAFVNALIETRFLECDRSLHDWEDYGGRLQERRAADRERSKRTRTKDQPSPSANGSRTLREFSAEHTHTQREASADRSVLQYTTVPYTTPQYTTTSSSSEEGAREEEPPYNAIMEKFNAECTRLEPVVGLHARRKQALRVLWAAHPNLEWIENLFRAANNCDFLCGHSKKGWKATFDWLTDLPNAYNVLENRYYTPPNPNGLWTHSTTEAMYADLYLDIDRWVESRQADELTTELGASTDA